MNNLKPIPLGVGMGILWALYVSFLAVTAMFGWGNALVTPLASLYLGYGPSVLGAIIGAGWAFGDGFIAGVVIAWVYNKVS